LCSKDLPLALKTNLTAHALGPEMDVEQKTLQVTSSVLDLFAREKEAGLRIFWKH
jgi:hypothetical protein